MSLRDKVYDIVHQIEEDAITFAKDMSRGYSTKEHVQHILTAVCDNRGFHTTKGGSYACQDCGNEDIRKRTRDEDNET